MADLNNIKRSLGDYITSESGITEERVIELIRAELLNQVGDLNNLETNAKDLIVNAINEILNSGIDNSVIEDLEKDVDELFQLGNDVKQMLVDALIANGLTKENLSTSNTFESLINYIDWFEYYKGYNIYEFTIPADYAHYSIYLKEDLRGDTYSGTVYTDWGDGTIDTNLSHVYGVAGTYQVITKYSVIDLNGIGNSHTKMFFSNVVNINKNITNASNMFRECVGLKVIDANEWDTSNITNMDGMFSSCSNLTTLNNDKWNVSKVSSAVDMYLNCNKLK